MSDQLKIKISKNLLASVLKEQQETFLSRDLGVDREILPALKDAVLAPQVLVITGLRRVGKSTLLAQIAKKYLKNNYYFINFEDERFIKFKTEDFDQLHETLIALFGEKKIFLIDEIQNIPEWEKFVRRLHDQGYKFIITGSNASLLSLELGTRLTGRSIKTELFPFSFKEFLVFNKVKIPALEIMTTSQRGKLRRLVGDFIKKGGIADALKYPSLEIHKSVYDDILYRDVAARYKLDNIRSLKELAFFLISNSASMISYNKLKDLLKVGSVNTITNYIEYLENSWLFFVVNRYAYSVKAQQIAAKKVYAIDSGLICSVGFSFSENMGKLMENVVYLHLRRFFKDVYYYKTAQDYEVDFYVPEVGLMLQVAQHLDTQKTLERELRALVNSAKEQKGARHLILITETQRALVEYEGFEIFVIPLYEWLLHGMEILSSNSPELKETFSLMLDEKMSKMIDQSQNDIRQSDVARLKSVSLG